MHTWFSMQSSDSPLVKLHLFRRQVSNLLSPGQVRTNTVTISPTGRAHTLLAASLEPLAVLPVVLVLVGEAGTAFPTAHLRTLVPRGEAHHRSPAWKALHQGLAAGPGKVLAGVHEMGIFIAVSLRTLTRNSVGYVVFDLPGVTLDIEREFGFGFWFADAAGSQHALVPTGAMGGEVVATGPRAE